MSGQSFVGFHVNQKCFFQHVEISTIDGHHFGHRNLEVDRMLPNENSN